MNIIAEIGLHHGGSVDVAKQLISCARTAGADMVKFQYFTKHDLAGRPANTGWSALKKYAMTAAQLAELCGFAEKIGLLPGCSVFGVDSYEKSLKKLVKMVHFFKVPAPQTENLYPVIDRDNPDVNFVFCSVYDGAKVPDIREDRKFFVIPMHCTPDYPTPWSELKLSNIITRRLRGWSCHAVPRHAEMGAIVATAMGANYMEFHFANESVPENSPDHEVSICPCRMQSIKRYCSEIEVAL